MERASAVAVGILGADGVEQVEVTTPRDALRSAGFDVLLLSPGGRAVHGYHYIEPGDEIDADLDIEAARPESFDCLVLPGGLGGPDTLRKSDTAVNLVRRFWESGKPVATICHGPWLLVESGVLRGRELTCASQISTDVVNAGGTYVDADAHVDSHRSPVLVSGRDHSTVDAFAEVLVEELSRAAVKA